MKKILSLILISLFSSACSQNKPADYKSEVEELQKFVKNTYEKDSTKIEAYVMNAENRKIFRIKSNDIFTEFDFEISYVYVFVKKNDQLVYIKKEPVSQSGDSAEFYEYYFNEKGRLIGAEKSLSTFSGESSDIIRYRVEYVLSPKTDKLERIKELYADIDWKEISQKSRKFKLAKEEGMLQNYMDYLDKITFRDIESFMKIEKIKYYK